MADKSMIEWTDATWTIVQGCDLESPGCTNCYVPAVLWRLANNPNPTVSRPLAGLVELHKGRPQFTGKVALREDRLDWPMQWRKPRRIFVPSHGDIFHDAVPDAFLDKIFAVMALCPQHTFQVLTKRAERMRQYLSDPIGPFQRIHAAAAADPEPWRWIRDQQRAITPYNLYLRAPLPLPNVWLGVSVEDQKRAVERIPELLRTPADRRFLSCEPLLGPVDLKPYLPHRSYRGLHSFPSVDVAGVDWVIVGGESGPRARPLRAEWVRSLVQQCKAAGVACFVKQMGRKVIDRNDAGFDGSGPTAWDIDNLVIEHNIHGYREDYQGADCLVTLADSKGGDMKEWPADLRVREFPNA